MKAVELDSYRSAIYEGSVSHCRLVPVRHHFRYRVYMMYLDLAEADGIFRGSWFWSFGRRNLMCFLRRDFLGDPGRSLDDAVRDCVEADSGIRPRGRIGVLTNLRAWGHIANPITTYYCFDETDTLQFMVAEVTNTPWGERHPYVIACDPDQRRVRSRFGKEHHVSPFMPMTMEYVWSSTLPEKRLGIHLHNVQNGRKVFSASLLLQRKAISPAALRGILFRYPFMSWKVTAAIYWQALKLACKKVPFHPHPKPSVQTDKQKGVEL